MDTHLLELLNEGRITAEEAYRCAVEKRNFEAKLPQDAQTE
jgi:twitching motility protein PilT